MKKIFLFIAILLFTIKSFSQTQTSQGFTKDHYLNKSKDQKTYAWLLAISGLGLSLAGILTNKNELNPPYFPLGTTMAATGAGIALLSIPLFISSSKNERKAASFDISNQNIYIPQQTNSVFIVRPTITLKVQL